MKALVTPIVRYMGMDNKECMREMACDLVCNIAAAPNSGCNGLPCQDCIFGKENIDQLDISTAIHFIGRHLIPDLKDKLKG